MTTIVARPHPLRNDFYSAEIEDGATLFDTFGDLPECVKAQVNGEVWERERWGETLPGDGVVTLYATPENNNIGRAIAMIAIAVLSVYTGGAAAAGYSGIAASAVQAGVSAAVTIAGSLAVNALIPPKMPSAPESHSANVRQSITGTRNAADPYGVVPRVYGNPRWYPKLAANPVTEIAGNDQYLRMMVVLGYGPLEVAGHRVGKGYPLLANVSVGDALRVAETSLDEYEDVEWEIGTADQMTLDYPDISEEAIGVALNPNPDYRDDVWVSDGVSATRTTAPGTKEISVDLVFPQGLFSINDNGTLSATSVRFSISYRTAGDTEATWVNVTDGTWQIDGPTKDTKRINKRWTVPKGQYDVLLERVSSYHGGTESVVTDCQWSVLRSVQSGPAYTGDHVLMGLRIRATDQLNGVIDQLNVKTQAVLRTYNGTTFEMKATNNPAWAYLDALTGKQVGRPVPDQQIDFDSIRQWAAFCGSQGLSYHWVHDANETVLERARTIAATGQASFALQDGRFGVVRDDPSEPTVQAITPRNAMGFSSSRQFKDLPHALRVKYIDPDTWADAERIVYRDGYNASNATRFEDFETQGVASAEEAYHHGQYHIRQAILRPETHTVQMDWENLAVMRGNRVRLAYDAIKVGLGWGRIKSINGLDITLDERVRYETSRAYGIRVRGATGPQSTTVVTSGVVGDTNTLTMAEPIDVEVGDLVLYGGLDKESVDCKVSRIQHAGDFTASLTLVPAAPDIYNYSDAPIWDPGITNPIPIDRIKPPTPVITSARGGEDAAHQNPDGSFQTLIRVSYALQAQPGMPSLQVEARYRVVGSDQWQKSGTFSVSGTLTIRDVLDGENYEIQIRAINGVMFSDWSASVTLVASGHAVSMPKSVDLEIGTFSIAMWPRGLYPNSQWEFYKSQAPLALNEVELAGTRLGIGSSYADTDLTPDTTYYYYIRGWSAQFVSAWYPVEVTTDNNPDAILKAITGKIDEGVLATSLREKVDKIQVNTEGLATLQEDLDQTRQNLADEASRLDGRVDSVQTGLAHTQKDLDDETARLDSRVDTVKGDLSREVGRLDGRVSNVQRSLQDTRDNLEASDAELASRLEAAEGAIVDEQQARETEDGFIAERLEGLTRTTDQNSVYIGQLQRVQQEGEELDAIIYEALNAETANRRASIRTEERVRIDGDSALAARSDALEAEIGTQAARITTEEQARVDGDSVLSSRIGELSAKVDALPQFASGFEAGTDFDQWNVRGTDTLTAETSNIYSGLQSGLLTSTATNPQPGNTTGATYAAIPPGATEAFEGFEVTVRVAAVQPDTNASTEFAVAYSTASVGNSGWQRFTPTDTWQVFEFSYTVPEGSSDSTDYLGIWADTSGSGKGIIIDGVTVRRVAGEILEITAALEEEQQARIDGDQALTSDLTALQAKVGDHAAAITEEQQARADADSAMARDISDMRADVNGNIAAITAEQQARADADDVIASYLQVLQTKMQDNGAAIVAERSARASDVDALTTVTDELKTDVGDNAAGLLQESKTRAAEDEALAQSLNRLSVVTEDQAGSISSLQRLQQEGDELDAIQFEAINVESANRQASIRTEERVRIDSDSALATRSDALEARVESADAAILAEQTARADADNALATDITGLRTDVDGNAAALTNEQKARSDGDSALASDISALSARTDSAESAINGEILARADADAALASRTDSMETRLGAAEADIVSEQQARSTADSAMASDLSGLSARLGETEAGIVAEQSARVDADEALASDVSGLTSRMGSAESALVDERQARASADSAMASDISGLTSRMGNTESAIQTESTARVKGDNSLAQQITDVQSSLGSDLAAVQQTMETNAKLVEDTEGGSLIINGSLWTGDATGWGSVRSDIGIQTSPERPANSNRRASPYCFHVPANYSSNTVIATSNRFPVREGEKLVATMDFATGGANHNVYYRVYYRFGTQDGSLVHNNFSPWQRANTAWQRLEPRVVEVPETAVDVYVGIQVQAGNNSNSWVTNLAVHRADVILSSQYMLKLQANGLVGGFGVYNDGATVEAGFDVDRFWIGRTSNDKVKPFVIDGGRVIMREALIGDATITNAKIKNGAITSGKLDNASINNAKIQNGAISRAKIQSAAVGRAQIGDLAVDTIRIANQAVTIPASSYTNGGINIGSGSADNWVTVQSVSINPQGNPVNLSISAVVSGISMTTMSSNYVQVEARLLRNGRVTLDFGRVFRDSSYGSSDFSFNGLVSFGYRTGTLSGNQRFDLQLKASFYDAGTCYIIRRSIMAMGVRK